MADAFLKMGKENLPKWNSIRRAKSMVHIENILPLPKSAVLFSSASESENKPRSCYNCPLFGADRCWYFGPDVPIKKFTFGEQDKDIEYWPVCGHWVPGAPARKGYIGRLLSPDDAGLGWVNAPKPGLSLSGSSCSGANGGDDCDHYEAATKDKRESPTGFCKVLRDQVDGMDCCAAWQDDDWVDYQTGSAILASLEDDVQDKENK